ncbi:MAG: recombinase family protein, partial [bacterium]|nr:recombinase family protein [bacterium]
MSLRRSQAVAIQQPVRCAIYTRKSTNEGLDQAFNSLDNQRDAGESYIASQRHENWTVLTDQYDDGGFSGGNTERPALKRLLADAEAGRIDIIVVYKLDRLSRSLLDFLNLHRSLESLGVQIVSVTEPIDTRTPI